MQRLLQPFRRLAPLLISLALVAGVGVVGMALSARSVHKAEDVHSADRLGSNHTLAVLAQQFMLFAFKEESAFSSTQQWSLQPGDPADAARLQAFASHSALLDQGAALVDFSGDLINVYTKEPGLPPPGDPGYNPIVHALLHGKPGLSSVMLVKGVPMVALGLPVMVRGEPRAVLFAFFRSDSNPLQTYNERLREGATGRAYIVDSAGRVLSSDHVSLLGHRAVADPALSGLAAGREGLVRFRRGGTDMVAAYSPLGLGGWGLINEQEASEFFGAIRSGGMRVRVALLTLLMVAAAGLSVLNHKRLQALRKAYDYKGELLANTTHELKTPVTVIRGAAITLGTRWRKMPPKQVDEFLGMIHRRSEGLANLVDRILMGARLEAGRDIAIRPEPIEVAGSLRRIGAEFAEVSPKHVVTLKTKKNLWVQADPEAFDHILGLLIENAVKYSPEGSKIRLEAEGENGRVLVRVMDDGMGMSEDDRKHIFDPFYKATRGDGQPFGGVGLGLSIVRHLVHRHGGDVWVDSEPGDGAVFTFTMPRGQEPGVERAPELEEVTS